MNTPPINLDLRHRTSKHSINMSCKYKLKISIPKTKGCAKNYSGLTLTTPPLISSTKPTNSKESGSIFQKMPEGLNQLPICAPKVPLPIDRSSIAAKWANTTKKATAVNRNCTNISRSTAVKVCVPRVLPPNHAKNAHTQVNTLLPVLAKLTKLSPTMFRNMASCLNLCDPE